MLRTKTIKVDENDYRIASLNVDQVDAFTEKVPEGAEAGIYREKTFQAVIDALNNAIIGDQDTPPADAVLWTMTRFRQKMDLPTFNALFDGIMRLSGLEMEPRGSSGEAAGSGQ